MKKARYDDLIVEYENPLEHECDVELGDVFIANGWQKPEDFCDSAWESLSAFVLALANGAEDFYDGWMKNKKSAMISCNDGFRPVSFLLEATEEELDKEFEDMAAQYGMDKEQVKSYSDEAQLEEMKGNIAVRKAVELLFNSAK